MPTQKSSARRARSGVMLPGASGTRQSHARSVRTVWQRSGALRREASWSVWWQAVSPRHCERTRSNPALAPRRRAGLLRRFASRNDGENCCWACRDIESSSPMPCQRSSAPSPRYPPVPGAGCNPANAVRTADVEVTDWDEAAPGDVCHRNTRCRRRAWAFYKLRDETRLPVICPTRQPVLAPDVAKCLGGRAGLRPPVYCAWGCFRNFGSERRRVRRRPRLQRWQTRSRVSGAALPLPLAGEGWGGGASTDARAVGLIPPPAALYRARRPPPQAGEAGQRKPRGEDTASRAPLTPSAPPSTRASARPPRA